MAFMSCSMTIWVSPRFLSSRMSRMISSRLGRVEAAHHLVEEEQLGLGGQDARHLELLPLADGEAAGEEVGLVRRAGRSCSCSMRHLARDARASAVRSERAHHHVVEDGHLRERPDLLPGARPSRAGRPGPAGARSAATPLKSTSPFDGG